MENQLISKNEDFQIVQLLERCLYNWLWFVLSVMLCCVVAFMYIKSAPKQYKRTAAVLVKEAEKDITAAFSERNPFRSIANVNNEIEAFKSPQLAQEVVRRLKMDINYITKEGMRAVDLYTQSPIIAVFPESKYFSFHVELLPDSVIVLSNFVQGDSKPKQSIKSVLNKETETPFGTIMISPSLYYSYDRNYKTIKVSKSDIKAVALNLSKTVKVFLSNKLNTVLSLEIEDVSIQRAEDVLNTLISVYQENWVTQKNKATITDLSFLDERIALAEQELMEIDDRVALYKSRNLVTDVRSAASLQMSQSMQYSGRIQEVSSQISIVEFIQEYLNDNTKLFELLPTNISGVNNPALETQVNNYNTLLNERNRLAANSSELNPIIIERNKSLQSLRQSIIQTVDNLIATLNLSLSGLQSQESRMTRNIASNPGQERYLMSVEREQKIKENLYLYLLQQREENRMALIVTPTNSQVISEPSGSMYPVKPNKIQVLLIALIFGCGIPFGVILVYDLLNATIRNKRDLSVLPAPLLGIIPEVKIKMVQEYGRGAINESFRILRTNLRFAGTKDTKVIQITSMEPNAGKTFIALNLAMSIAFTGKKVALLDLDLRRATLTKHINKLKHGMGIAEQKENDEIKGIAAILKNIAEDNKIKGKNIADMWLKMAQDMNPIIKYTMPSEEAEKMTHVNFDIILADTKPPNPAELLMGDRLARIIEVLKDTLNYDYIFIDSPPVHPVVDTILVAEHADISLFVVREKITDRRKLPDIENIYNDGKLKNMHLILNGATADAKTSRYDAYYTDNDEKDRNIFKSAEDFNKKLKLWSANINAIVKKMKNTTANESNAPDNKNKEQ